MQQKVRTNLALDTVEVEATSKKWKTTHITEQIKVTNQVALSEGDATPNDKGVYWTSQN